MFVNELKISINKNKTLSDLCSIRNNAILTSVKQLFKIFYVYSTLKAIPRKLCSCWYLDYVGIKYKNNIVKIVCKGNGFVVLKIKDFFHEKNNGFVNQLAAQ